MFNANPSKTLLGYLLRHGDLKNMNVWDGWGDFDLSEEGERQVEAAARWLSFERIGRVISSDVPRTNHSAQIIMDVCNVACPFIMSEPNLRPWMVADFTGKPKTPENIAKFQKYIDDPSLIIQDGESRNELHERVQVILSYMTTPYKGLITVCALHNSVLKSLMGLDDIREAVSPGGLVSVWMDAKGDISFQIELGDMNTERGVS